MSRTPLKGKRSRSKRSSRRSNIHLSWEPSSEFFSSGGGMPGNSPLHESEYDVDSIYSNRTTTSITSAETEAGQSNHRYQQQHQWDQDNHQPQRKTFLRSPSYCYKVLLMFAIVVAVSFQSRTNTQIGKDLLGFITNTVGVNVMSSSSSSHIPMSEKNDSNNLQTLKTPRLTKEKSRLPNGHPTLQANGNTGAALTSPNQHQLMIPGAEQLLAPSAPLPTPELNGFKNTWQPHDPKDVPIFWHVPKAGGSTVKDIVGACHGRVIANENGILFGHDKDTELQTITIDGQGETRFVNVDTTTLEGIERAKNMGLGNSGLAGLIITPYVHQTETLFSDDDTEPKGRLFATFRHPISRAVSMFKYLQYAEWEPTYNPIFKTWTLEQYVRSEHIENNWMTRHLSNELEGDLTSSHLQIALDVLRRKFIVGLMHRMDESIQRFEAYFGWRYTINPTAQETCRESLFTVGTNTNRKKIETPTDDIYTLIAQQNVFDLELYKYIEQLFQEQEEFVRDIPKDFRLVNAECSKCADETDDDQVSSSNLRNRKK